MATEEILKRFLEKNIMKKHGMETLQEDDSLLEHGILDSTDIFELVAFIEREFNIEVLDEEVAPDHFETLKDITSFVNTKLK